MVAIRKASLEARERIDADILRALRLIAGRLANQDINWVITGSLGMVLQGMDIEAHDIDIQTDRTGVYSLERLFSEYVKKPVRFSSAERVRSHFGALEIAGIKIELMGDIQKREEGGTWEAPVDIERYKRWVQLEAMRLPVLSLEYEYQAYLKLGRIEKAELLRKWLEERSSR